MALAIITCLVMAAAGMLVWVRSHGLVYAGRTRAGWTTVHDDPRVADGRIRVLDVAGTYQSATYLDERWAYPVFPYLRLFDRAFDAWPDGTIPLTACVLGGGGYAIPKHLVAHFPQVTRIDTVEIDPAIERIARRHFFLDRLEQRYGAESSGRLRLHLADARTWLEASELCYDIIINDCFSALVPDKALMTAKAAQLIRSHLSSQGVYLTNVVSALEGPDASILYETVRVLQEHFAHVWLCPCSPNHPQDHDNNVVIATDSAHTFEGAWEWPEASE